MPHREESDHFREKENYAQYEQTHKDRGCMLEHHRKSCLAKTEKKKKKPDISLLCFFIQSGENSAIKNELIQLL